MKNIQRIDAETQAIELITMDEAKLKLSGWWKDEAIEDSLLEGVVLFTPYASYSLVK